jgi:hypothetical protein
MGDQPVPPTTEPAGAEHVRTYVWHARFAEFGKTAVAAGVPPATAATLVLLADRLLDGVHAYRSATAADYATQAARVAAFDLGKLPPPPAPSEARTVWTVLRSTYEGSGEPSVWDDHDAAYNEYARLAVMSGLPFNEERGTFEMADGTSVEIRETSILNPADVDLGPDHPEDWEKVDKALEALGVESWGRGAS